MRFVARLFCTLIALPSLAATIYVGNGGSSVSPYSTTNTAATNVNLAIKVALSNAAPSTIWVMPGTYPLLDAGLTTNLTIAGYSHNPADAVIDAKMLGRAVNSGSGTTLADLLVTHGYTNSQHAPGNVVVYGAGVNGGTLSNCIITANYGGADNQVSYNAPFNGAAAHGVIAYHCLISYNTNSCSQSGYNTGPANRGAVAYSTLYDCIVCYNYCGCQTGLVWETEMLFDCSTYNCLIFGNVNYGNNYAGSIVAWDGNYTNINCTICNNVGYKGYYFGAAGMGLREDAYTTSATVYNCISYNNQWQTGAVSNFNPSKIIGQLPYQSNPYFRNVSSAVGMSAQNGNFGLNPTSPACSYGMASNTTQDFSVTNVGCSVDIRGAWLYSGRTNIPAGCYWQWPMDNPQYRKAHGL